MSVPLSPTSARRIAAARFAAELRKALEARDVSLKAIERATGISHTNLWTYKAGNNLPRVETALRIAEALHWPKLADIAREGRQAVCARPRCAVTFINEGGSPKRYCSDDCRQIHQILKGEDFEPGGRALLAAVRSELGRVHGTTHAISRKRLKSAADEYASSGSKRGARLTTLEGMLERHRAAAAAFCRGCEPDGFCQTPACELRPISPLPLITDTRDVETATKAPGAWGNKENRATMVASIRAANARRWSRPGERERFRTATAERWAAMTPEQRAEAGRRISRGRRAS